MVSPVDLVWDEIRRWVKLMVPYFDELGYWRPVAFTAVFHGLRKKCKFCGQPAESNPPAYCTNEKCGQYHPWVWLFGPHVHFSSNMYSTGTKFHDFTGVVRHVIRSFDIDKPGELESLMAYEVGHSVFTGNSDVAGGTEREKFHAVYYGGAFSNRYTGRRVVPDRETGKNYTEVVRRDEFGEPYKLVLSKQTYDGLRWVRCPGGMPRYVYKRRRDDAGRVIKIVYKYWVVRRTTWFYFKRREYREGRWVHLHTPASLMKPLEVSALW